MHRVSSQREEMLEKIAKALVLQYVVLCNFIICSFTCYLIAFIFQVNKTFTRRISNWWKRYCSCENTHSCKILKYLKILISPGLLHVHLFRRLILSVLLGSFSGQGGVVLLQGIFHIRSDQECYVWEILNVGDNKDNNLQDNLENTKHVH